MWDAAAAAAAVRGVRVRLGLGFERGRERGVGGEFRVWHRAVRSCSRWLMVSSECFRLGIRASAALLFLIWRLLRGGRTHIGLSLLSTFTA